MKPQQPKNSNRLEKLKFPFRNDEDFQACVEEFLSGLQIEQELIKLRKSQGLTQCAVAEMLNVTQPFIAKMESGHLTNIELRTLARAVIALNGRLEIKIRAKAATRAARAHA